VTVLVSGSKEISIYHVLCNNQPYPEALSLFVSFPSTSSFNIRFFPKCPHLQPLATLAFSSDVQAIMGLSSPVRHAMAVGTSSRCVAPWPLVELARAHASRHASGGEVVLHHAFGWSSCRAMGPSSHLRHAMEAG
jgi:hypothetical protein